MAHGGINFTASQFVFAGYSGAQTTRSTCGCRPLAERSGVGEITAHGLRHSAATILLNHVGKISGKSRSSCATRISARPCAHVGYEQTRQTSEAPSQVLE